VEDGSQPRAGAFGEERSRPAPLVPAGFDLPIVLGLDPGTQVVGYGALILAADGPRLLTAGVLRARARLPVFERLGILADAFDELLHLTRPTTVVIENAFTHRNPRTAIRLGEARGMVIAAAVRSGATIEEISPSEAKRRVTGNGNAAKAQVAAMVPRLVQGLDVDLPEDATDALALALAHARRRDLDRATGR